MQLNFTTDYAIRIVLYLAYKGEIASSSEISKKIEMSKSYALKVTKRLFKAGILDRKKGIYGGFFLSKKPEQICKNRRNGRVERN